MSATTLEPAASPTDLLQLVGHPLRWQLLGALARSDRTVHELTGVVGQPQNLVSYHLGKLRGGGLVSGRRSSADRRDTYYSADLTRLGTDLSAAGGALHPGLRLVAPPAPGSIARTHPVRVLFLCTGNSARSQMAEALAQAGATGVVEARSAGSTPKPMHPNAVRVMREEHGIDLSGRSSKHLDVFADERFDWVVTLCDRVREGCPELPGAPEAIHWSFPDPSAGPGDDDATYPAFRELGAELERRVGFLLAAIAEQTSEPSPTKEQP